MDNKKCNDIKDPLLPDPEFRCVRCLEKAQPVDGRRMKEVKINDEMLKAVPEFCYLLVGGMLYVVGDGCELTPLQMFIGKVLTVLTGGSMNSHA